jgi:hypothetical protein
MNTESTEEFLSALRDSIPAPEKQDSGRAAFLARAAKMRGEHVSKLPVARHNGVKGGHTLMTTNNSPVSRRSVFALRLVLVAIIGLTFAFAVSPDLQALAQQIVQFFARKPDVELAEVFIGGGEEPSVPDDGLSFEAGLAMVSYDALVPSAMPQAYRPYRAWVHAPSSTLTLDYRCGDIWGLMLTQSPQTESFSLAGAVGEGAAVVNVTINGQPGQFVQGGWKYDRPAEIGPEGPVRAVPTTRRWDSSIQFYQLAWSANGMHYALATSSGIEISEAVMGVCQVNQASLVSIAESLN